MNYYDPEIYGDQVEDLERELHGRFNADDREPTLSELMELEAWLDSNGIGNKFLGE